MTSTNKFTFQSSFKNLITRGSRQTVYMFGAANQTPVFGMLTISSDGSNCSWNGTGTVTAEIDATGKVTVALPDVSYDVFLLLSARTMSWLYVDTSSECDTRTMPHLFPR